MKVQVRNLRQFFILVLALNIFWIVSGCDKEDHPIAGPDLIVPEEVTVGIKAVVENITDPWGILDNEIEVGASITGAYVYDQSTEGENFDPGWISYLHDTSPYGIFLEINGNNFGTATANIEFVIEIVNNHTLGDGTIMDGFSLRSENNCGSDNDTEVDYISWNLSIFDADVISSSELSSEPPRLSDWTSGVGANIITIRGHIKSDTNKTYTMKGRVTEVFKVE